MEGDFNPAFLESMGLGSQTLMGMESPLGDAVLEEKPAKGARTESFLTRVRSVDIHPSNLPLKGARLEPGTFGNFFFLFFKV